jgi:CRP-like cAMP-binding protein
LRTPDDRINLNEPMSHIRRSTSEQGGAPSAARQRAMSKSKRAPTPKPVDVLDWAGARTQRAEYGPAAVIFAQGDSATSVMYVETGAVRLSVLSHAGKEAVVAVLDAG